MSNIPYDARPMTTASADNRLAEVRDTYVIEGQVQRLQRLAVRVEAYTDSLRTIANRVMGVQTNNNMPGAPVSPPSAASGTTVRAIDEASDALSAELDRLGAEIERLLNL